MPSHKDTLNKGEQVVGAEARNMTVGGVHFRSPVLIRTGAAILTEEDEGESQVTWLQGSQCRWVLVTFHHSAASTNVALGGPHLHPVNACCPEKAQHSQCCGKPIELSSAMAGGMTELESGFDLWSHSGFNRALLQASTVVIGTCQM